MIVLPYLTHVPTIGTDLDAAADAAIIGRTVVGTRCRLGRLATLRGDGESIFIGDDCWFGDYSTVHIAHGHYSTTVGDGCSIGRYALVHACVLGAGVVFGENAVVMDTSEVGPGAVIAADSVVPPGKKLAGGWLHADTPAKPVRELAPGELEALHARVRGTRVPDAALDAIVCSTRPAAAVRQAPGSGFGGVTVGSAYVAPSASLTGALALGARASVWFGVEIIGEGAAVEVGDDSNVQDNTRVALGAGERLRIGRRVTIGHNVRIDGACEVGDDAMLGMGSTVGRGTVVGAGAVVAAGAVTEPGTVVAAGEIWAGAPARRWKPVPPENRENFARGVGVYVEYTGNYTR